MIVKPKINISLFIACFTAFFAGFYFNALKIVDQDKFIDYDRQCESLTIGRIVKSRTDGLFSGSALPGRCACKCTELQEKINFQFDSFNENKKCENFYPYLSQIGFHAIFYSMVDAVLPFSPPVNLAILKAVKSATLALAMSLIVLWFFLEWGLVASLFVFFGVLLTPSFTLFGRDLWFCIWTNFLPFIVLLFLLRKESRHGKPSEFLIIFFGSLAVLANFLFNGYEWVSTTLVMASIPFFYYWRKDEWPFSRLARRVAYLAAGSIASILVTVSILAFQISQIKGKFSDGIDWIIFSFQKRSYGGSDLPEAYANQINHPLKEVFLRYFGGTAYEFPPFITDNLPMYLSRIFYAEIIFVFLVCTFVIYLPGNLLRLPADRLKSFRDLAIVTWISILAPFSWYIIFKGHAWSHYHLNYITWFMPFCLFGLAMTGVMVTYLAGRIGITSRKYSP